MEDKAIKHDSEKPRMELLPSGALLEVAKVLTFGAKKYDAHNWRKGFKYSRLLGAMQRHIAAFSEGEDTDPETGLSHMAHAACCVLFLLEHELKNYGEDDRYGSGLHKRISSGSCPVSVPTAGATTYKRSEANV